MLEMYKDILQKDLNQYIFFCKNNENNMNIIDFSPFYGIYQLKKEIEPLEMHNEMTKIPSMKTKVYKVNDITSMMYMLDTLIGQDSFYGALMIVDKKPINPLSYHFIRNFDKYKELKDFKFAVYTINDKIDKNIAKKVEEKILELDITDIKFDVENSNISFYMYAPQYLEEFEYHLSSLHKKIDENTNIMDKDLDWIYNIGVSDTNEKTIKILKDNDWLIELQAIESGVLFPSYGFFQKKGNKIIDIACATKHPNISTNGTNYCTGTNVKYSIQGVSELNYGNLNSPMNNTIWSNNSHSIAKGFQKVFFDIIKNFDLN